MCCLWRHMHSYVYVTLIALSGWQKKSAEKKSKGKKRRWCFYFSSAASLSITTQYPCSIHGPKYIHIITTNHLPLLSNFMRNVVLHGNPSRLVECAVTVHGNPDVSRIASIIPATNAPQLRDEYSLGTEIYLVSGGSLSEIISTSSLSNEFTMSFVNGEGWRDIDCLTFIYTLGSFFKGICSLSK